MAKRQRDEELESNSDYSSSDASSAASISEDEETVQEKRVRLAKEYIARTKAKISNSEIDAEEIDNEIIASRIKQDLLENEGVLFKDYTGLALTTDCIFRGHESSVTCSIITPCEKFVYSASKEGLIVKFDLEKKVKVCCFRRIKKGDGHSDAILCMAVSSDSKYLATGGKDKKICIWSVKEDKLLRCFTQHRDEVTGLAFQNGKNMLYSGSTDRTVKVFSIDEMTYVETLFGHQSSIMSVCNFGNKDRCLSVGGRDRTVRLWKIVEESQLVFRASGGRITKDGIIDDTGSLDAVTFLNQDNWVSGSDGGCLALWSIQRKKPVFSIENAHGRLYTKVNSDDEIIKSDSKKEVYVDFGENLEKQYLEGEWISKPYWITAVECVPYSNLLVSGSHDGFLRFWKINDDKAISLITKIPVKGFVNSIQASKSGNYLTVSVGKEHRNGRWAVEKKAKNCTLVIKLAKQ